MAYDTQLQATGLLMAHLRRQGSGAGATVSKFRESGCVEALLSEIASCHLFAPRAKLYIHLVETPEKLLLLISQVVSDIIVTHLAALEASIRLSRPPSGSCTRRMHSIVETHAMAFCLGAPASACRSQ